jgi:glycine/D-amino acid oxidase-like deaminating enzyme
VPPIFFEGLRAFLRNALPALAEDEIVYSRCCLYCDTRDGDFLIDRHPEYTGLTVACGGSGHAFKFGLVLGQVIADRVEDKPHPHLAKFRWR